MGITDEHDELGMRISINQIESPQGRLIPYFKGNLTSRKYRVATIFFNHFLNLPMYTSVKAPQHTKPSKQNMHLKNMQKHLV